VRRLGDDGCGQRVAVDVRIVTQDARRRDDQRRVFGRVVAVIHRDGASFTEATLIARSRRSNPPLPSFALYVKLSLPL